MTSKGFGYVEKIEEASPAQMVEILFAVLSWFKVKGLGNPFNYNRAFEFIQAYVLHFNLLPVARGPDGDSDDGTTTEFKATEWQGFTKKGKEKSHSWSYNGTSRFDTLEEQEEYCKDISAI